MKRIITMYLIMALTISVFAQSPEKMSYQAVMRNTGGALVTNQAVGMKVSILQGSPTGTLVYQEIYNPNPQTNANGLVCIEIGGGIPLTGTFSAISWSGGPYFLKTETDPAGGTNYTITGTTQLLSVPFALFSKTADYNSLLNKPTIINSQWTSSGSDIYFDAGKVGIATTPSDFNLTLNGRARFRSGVGGTAGILYTNAENDNIGFIGVADNNHLGIWGSGGGGFGVLMDVTSLNVGIGTISPVTRLEVNGVITATGANFTGTTTVPSPVNATDAATKAYVDLLLEKIEYLESLVGVEDPVTDIEGNVYKTIRIGTQQWMTENLKTTRYKNGTAIPLVTNNTAWGNLLTPGYCWYNNDESANKSTYGALYNWYTVNTGALCPTDWHVPTDIEWTTLITYLGGENVAGGKLKEIGTIHWASPNTGATNETIFTALPGGYRSTTGAFNIIGSFGYWWSATETGASSAYYRGLDYNSSNVGSYADTRKYGFSVRCIRD